MIVAASVTATVTVLANADTAPVNEAHARVNDATGPAEPEWLREAALLVGLQETATRSARQPLGATTPCWLNRADTRQIIEAKKRASNEERRVKVQATRREKEGRAAKARAVSAEARKNAKEKQDAYEKAQNSAAQTAQSLAEDARARARAKAAPRPRGENATKRRATSSQRTSACSRQLPRPSDRQQGALQALKKGPAKAVRSRHHLAW